MASIVIRIVTDGDAFHSSVGFDAIILGAEVAQVLRYLAEDFQRNGVPSDPRMAPEVVDSNGHPCGTIEVIE